VRRQTSLADISTWLIEAVLGLVMDARPMECSPRLGGDNQDENRIASPELLPNHDSCLA
jgi:hypothetical protein